MAEAETTTTTSATSAPTPSSTAVGVSTSTAPPVWDSKGWHWHEHSNKQIDEWAKSRLRELLNGYEFTNVKARITGVDKLTGDCQINIRKGKKIHGYEFDITLKWDGEIADGEGNELVKGKGTIRWPCIAEDVDDEEYEYDVSLEDIPNPGLRRLKKLVEEGCATELRERIKIWTAEYKAME